jgi:hypothetical protein
VLVLVENKKPSLLSGCCLDQSENGVAKIDTYAEMLESVDPTKDGGWLRCCHELAGVSSCTIGKDLPSRVAGGMCCAGRAESGVAVPVPATMM